MAESEKKKKSKPLQKRLGPRLDLKKKEVKKHARKKGAAQDYTLDSKSRRFSSIKLPYPPHRIHTLEGGGRTHRGKMKTRASMAGREEKKPKGGRK